MKARQAEERKLDRFSECEELPATFAIIATLMCITPALFAQRDVRVFTDRADGSKISAAVSSNCGNRRVHTTFRLSG